MQVYRLNRLFNPDSGRCLDVAVDHGFPGELDLLAGIEDMERTVATLVEAGPDAIQLTPGQAPLLQRIPGPRKPALVLRTDLANVFGRDLPAHLFSEVVEAAVTKAIALDAVCVVVNLLSLPGRAELHHACVRNVAALRAACDPVGMPLMVEALALRPERAAYGSDTRTDAIVPLVRQAAELGADVIKADPTEDLDEYGRVIEAAGGRPVLPRGGGRVADDAVLRRTEALIRGGAAGIVYGRNVIQHERPAAMTRALMSVVHDGASADEALALLAG